MRKLYLLSALTIVIFSAFEPNKETANTDAASEVCMQDGYTEIENSALPETVAMALSTDYPKAVISKVYMNKDRQYKLEVILKDGVLDTLYADDDVKWLKM
ncbi:hypothetical protein [Sediminicola sp. 1XM1-17]|uniref:hypothetical protein n=1 Tax=Sediminicola sp. 1XM1-17 TaxID=3127702 RepID=UPI00307896B9